MKKLFSALTTAYSLGSNPLQKTKLFFIALFFPLKRLAGIRKEYVFKVELKKGCNRFFVYLTDGSDIGVLKEMFIEEQYKIDLEGIPSIIIDLGSNVGFSVIYFKLKYPEARVYACEPDPSTYVKLQRNIEQFKDVYAYNIAISDHDGTESFFIHPDSSMSSSLQARVPEQQSIEVVSKKLDTFLLDEGIKEVDLIKFDVEGSEFQILSSFANIAKSKAYIGELHLDLVSVTKDDFLKLFQQFKIASISISATRYLLSMWRQ